MGELYRRIVSEKGRVRYERVHEWDLGDPAEGLWVIRKKGHGLNRTWLRELATPLPAVPPAVAWVASKCDIVADALVNELARAATVSAQELARAVVNALIDEASQWGAL